VSLRNKREVDAEYVQDLVVSYKHVKTKKDKRSQKYLKIMIAHKKMCTSIAQTKSTILTVYDKLYGLYKIYYPCETIPYTTAIISYNIS
jgi:hypothetical protein